MPQLSYDLLKHDRGDSQSKEMSLLTSSRFVTYISETSFTMNSVELSKQVYVQLAEESSYQRTASALRCYKRYHGRFAGLRPKYSRQKPQ